MVCAAFTGQSGLRTWIPTQQQTRGTNRPFCGIPLRITSPKISAIRCWQLQPFNGAIQYSDDPLLPECIEMNSNDVRSDALAREA